MIRWRFIFELYVFDDKIEVGTTAVNFLALSFQILYLPGIKLNYLTYAGWFGWIGTIWSVYMMDKYSMRTGLLVGGGLSCVGSIVRYVGVLTITSSSFSSSTISPTTSYLIVFLGQCLAGDHIFHVIFSCHYFMSYRAGSAFFCQSSCQTRLQLVFHQGDRWHGRWDNEMTW